MSSDRGVGPHPAIMYMHGGGMVFGGLDTNDRFASLPDAKRAMADFGEAIPRAALTVAGGLGVVPGGF